MRDTGPAVACHPDSLTINTALEVAAPAVLLQEGVEGGEELGHGRETTMGQPSRRLVPFGRVPGVPATVRLL